MPKKPRVHVEPTTFPKPPEITMWAGEVARVKGWGSNGLPTKGDVEAYGLSMGDQKRAEETRRDEGEGEFQ